MALCPIIQATGQVMARPFDATTKQLIESYPADWLALGGLPVPAGAAVRLVDADLSSFTLAADKLVRVEGPEVADPYVGHVEAQAGPDPHLDRRVLTYNAVAGARHDLPVRSVVYLLRPEALSPRNTGRVQDLVDPHCRLDFSYRLVRVWEMSPEALLVGGLGTLPLAAIAATPPQLVPVYRRMAERLDRDVPPAQGDELWTAAYILSGLRYPPREVGPIMRGVRRMKESLTYQAILEEGREEGRAEGERKVLIRQGTKKFGPPDERSRSALEGITDLSRLEVLAERLLDASGWEDLLTGIG
jgi:predicted transposase YdaD